MTISRKIFLLPFLTIFLLLLLDAFLISRLDEVPSIYQKSQSLPFPEFRTRDLRGNTVTHEIFRGKFSIVCLWVMQDATTSRELLETLSAWRNTSPKPFQLMGIVGDLRDTEPPERLDVAREIVGDCPEDVPHLLVNDDMEGFLRRIHNAPTVCFVNEHGELVGQPVVGNEPDLIRKEAERLMERDSLQNEIAGKIQDSLFH
ncbi:MAG: hypothetical protein IJT01_10815 [Selenomonadaceae bacterium]|nr:hypothetical protein [Selenomonadaceae bacterium]